MRLRLAALTLGLLAACADGDATDGACVVSWLQPGGGKALYIATNAPGTRSFTFEVSGSNVVTAQVVPLGVVTHDHPLLVGTAAQQDPFQAWNFKWVYHEIRGDYRAKPDGTLYKLPWQAGRSFPVTQGWNGSFSHQGLDALDFTMPVGTPVRAARGGLVVYTYDQATAATTDPAQKDAFPANEVEVQHDDGTLGIYAHLDHLGVKVHAGDRVATGDQLGVSGNTGFSSGPHLHFECRGPDEQLRNRAFPVLFQTTPGATAGVQPLDGETYTAF